MSSVLRKDLRTSTAEGMASSVMVGIGETYLPVFVLALSGSQLACGLVSTVPLVIGAVLQLGSPWLMRKCGSYRRGVSLCALIQAATFVPLLVAAVTGHISMVLVFALVAVYWATGLGRQRAVERLDGNARAVAGAGALLCLADAGLPMGHRAGLRGRWRCPATGRSMGDTAGRLRPVVLHGVGQPLYFRRTSGQPAGTAAAAERSARPSLTAIFHTLTDGANGRLLLYLMAAQAAVQISGPYFNPYMLGELQFSYSTYAIVVCAAIVAKILFLPTVGRIADRVGVRRVFWISAAAIVPVPALWLVSNNCGYLIAVQIYSGMAWCAFDLATLLLFFETIPRQKRVDVLAFFNLANSAATAGGSLLGAGILAALGANRHAYLILFALSTIARAAAIVLLARIPAHSAAGQATRAIPAPHYLRPALARPVVCAGKARDERENMVGSLRP